MHTFIYQTYAYINFFTFFVVKLQYFLLDLLSLEKLHVKRFIFATQKKNPKTNTKHAYMYIVVHYISDNMFLGFVKGIKFSLWHTGLVLVVELLEISIAVVCYFYFDKNLSGRIFTILQYIMFDQHHQFHWEGCLKDCCWIKTLNKFYHYFKFLPFRGDGHLLMDIS